MLAQYHLKNGFTLHKKTANEFSSACPRPGCGGVNRLSIWRDERGGRSYCRQCGETGDLIDYLRRYCGMSYAEAAQVAGKGISPLPGKRERRPTAAPAPPSETWLARAKAFRDWCHMALINDAARMSWLLSERGLNEATVRRFKLGWLPRDRYEDFKTWGLPPEKRDNGREKSLFIPAGLVIPGPGRLRIRRTEPGEFERYYVIRGSGNEPLTIGRDLPADCPAVVVESELDGVLLAQEFTRPYQVVAVGSTANGPTPTMLADLKRRPWVLIALDNDDAGQKATQARWLPVLSNGFAVRFPGAHKDPTEAHVAGHSLDGWRTKVEEQVRAARGY